MKDREMLKIVADTTSHACLQIKQYLGKEIISKLKILRGVLVRSSA